MGMGLAYGYAQKSPISHSNKCMRVTFEYEVVTLASPSVYPHMVITLRKLVHAINTDFLALQIENFQQKIFDIFLIFAQNIDCGYTLEPPRQGGSNEYSQSMFWSKNKKNRYTPANIQVGFKGIYIARTCFPDVMGPM